MYLFRPCNASLREVKIGDSAPVKRKEKGRCPYFAWCPKNLQIAPQKATFGSKLSHADPIFAVVKSP